MLKYKSVFFVGIKGAAMVHLAVLLNRMGITVTGADTTEVFPTDSVLHSEGIPFQSFDDAMLTPDTDLVVYSAAHKGSENPLVIQAREKGIDILHQASLLQEVSATCKHRLAVAGCHGKTTTSALLAYMLLRLDQEPSYLVGTSTFTGYPGGDYRGRNYFVYEADEYALDPPRDTTSKLMAFRPDTSIITNIDFDHPDVFTSIEQTKEVFSSYIGSIVHHRKDKAHPPIIACSDDPNLSDVLRLCKRQQYVTYGFEETADYLIKHAATTESGSSFLLTKEREVLGRFLVGLYGENNIRNTAAVIIQLLHLGFSAEQINEHLPGFTGADRRFQLLSTVHNTLIFDDYAHHPSEITSVIDTARKRFPDRKITLVFQPHTYSRTVRFQKEIVQALADADMAIIAPIFGSAREQDSDNQVTSQTLQDLAVKKMIQTIFGAADEDGFIRLLNEQIQPGGVIILAGAGNIYQYQDQISSILSSQK